MAVCGRVQPIRPPVGRTEVRSTGERLFTVFGLQVVGAGAKKIGNSYIENQEYDKLEFILA